MPRKEREYIGFSRVMDNNNRIVIPVEIREFFNINPKDELEFKIVRINKTKYVIELTKKGE